MRVIHIGVAGLGTVGGEVVRLLRERREDFIRRLGAELRLAAVCDRRANSKARRLRLPSFVRRTTRYRDFLRHERLDIVVETLGGLGDARALVLGALRSGRDVATANKRLLAHHWDEVFLAARRAGRRVRFEASVAGGIPILQALGKSLVANRIERVSGILNGTTNFILTRMAHDGVELLRALSLAQELGLAERDARLDLDGTDAAHKVAVIGSVVTGGWVRPEEVSRRGIGSLRLEDMRFAVEALGKTIRLLGVIEVDWSSSPRTLTAFVAPTLVDLDHPLAAVHGEFNAVMVRASAAGDLMFYGKGAGAGPAASAVVGDVFLLAQESLSGAIPPTSALPASPLAARTAPRGRFRLRPVQETICPFFIRLEAQDRPGVLARIAGILGRHRLSIAQIHQGPPSAAASRAARVPIFLTTHPSRQGELERALREILALPFVSAEHAWLRMLPRENERP